MCRAVHGSSGLEAPKALGRERGSSATAWIRGSETWGTADEAGWRWVKILAFDPLDLKVPLSPILPYLRKDALRAIGAHAITFALPF